MSSLIPPRIPVSRRRRPLLGAVLGAALVVAVVGCSSDGDDAGKASDSSSKAASTTTARETTTTTSPEDSTATTTTSIAASDDTETPTTAASGDPSAFSGPLDGQDGVDVKFRREGSKLVDLTAADIALTCLPLGDGEETTVAVDVDIDEVPVAESGVVDFLLEDADYSPSLSGEFNDAGQFVGTLSLNGGDDESVCGGEFSFVAAPG